MYDILGGIKGEIETKMKEVDRSIGLIRKEVGELRENILAGRKATHSSTNSLIE